ncbi:cell adhesion molecule CEACAM5-like [Pyxicephalus adspersus]|uniref:cell adhesion molecule CEACAM5-like n=1 Tax=Pyxicephalus adspersus TaxID=30357 RepID=UPI003B5ABF8A
MLTSGAMYVKSGSDIESCNMTCPHRNGVLELFRECRGVIDPLLEIRCDNMNTKNAMRSRLHLNSSGCWSLTQAEKGDSCQYNIDFHSSPTARLTSTDIRILDPILISNITSNSSGLGQDLAVSIHFSGEESAVTWEVDGEPVPERYRLINDNRTLIVPNLQRDDAKRRFRVRITNPVSGDTQDYLLNDRMIIREPETKVPDPILISNITSNSSGLGQDLAVSVHFSGEESAVTWEVDGEPLPERYRLIDDNRTLIIPNLQRDDAKRRFRVRNPISEDTRD